MQQISNKTLTLLLLAAIIVSVTGTIMSINRINRLLQVPVVGMASSSGTGMVNVTIAAQTSITATDAIIQFGSCSPTTNYGCNVSSNVSSAECSCTGGNWPDNLTIKNDGNRDVNVTVQTGSLASSFIGGTTPYGAEMYFSTRNASDNRGCYNITGQGHTYPAAFDGTRGMQWGWSNFSAADTEYLACANLTYGSNTNSFSLFARLFLPANAPAGGNRSATLTFTATNW